jgi:DNA transposition AAA+ family ATPase
MSSTEAREMLNVSAEQMHAAIAAYRGAGATDEQCRAIEWAYLHCVNDMARNAKALADELGYDRTNVWKLFMGKYEGSLENVGKSIAAMRKRVQARVAIGFVRTAVTERISEAIDYAHTMGAMVVIRGDTGRGKSATARLWQSEHNHGSTFYVELPERTTYMRFMAAAARAMGSANSGTSDSFRQYVGKRLGRNRTLIVDEAGHLYNPKRPDPTTFDALRSLHDETRCGMVLIFTLPYWDAINRGPMSGYFEQFLGRVSYELEIPPDTIFEEEIAAICEHVCGRFGGTPDGDLLRQAAQIAGAARGRIRTLVTTLEHAAVYARTKNVPLDGASLKKARAWRDAGGDWSKLTKV